MNNKKINTYYVYEVGEPEEKGFMIEIPNIVNYYIVKDIIAKKLGHDKFEIINKNALYIYLTHNYSHNPNIYIRIPKYKIITKYDSKEYIIICSGKKIIDLKKDIEIKLNIPIEQQILSNGVTQLNDDYTLEYADLSMCGSKFILQKRINMTINKKRKINSEEAKCMDDIDEYELPWQVNVKRKSEEEIDEEIENSPEIKRLKKTIMSLEERIEKLENENNKYKTNNNMICDLPENINTNTFCLSNCNKYVCFFSFDYIFYIYDIENKKYIFSRKTDIIKCHIISIYSIDNERFIIISEKAIYYFSLDILKISYTQHFYNMKTDIHYTIINKENKIISLLTSDNEMHLYNIKSGTIIGMRKINFDKYYQSTRNNIIIYNNDDISIMDSYGEIIQKIPRYDPAFHRYKFIRETKINNKYIITRTNKNIRYEDKKRSQFYTDINNNANIINMLVTDEFIIFSDYNGQIKYYDFEEGNFKVIYDCHKSDDPEKNNINYLKLSNDNKYIFFTIGNSAVYYKKLSKE